MAVFLGFSRLHIEPPTKNISGNSKIAAYFLRSKVVDSYTRDTDIYPFISNIRVFMLISIAVPIHNEEASIRQLMQEIDAVISSVNYEIEVVFVDDSSTDNSGAILKEIEGAYHYVRAFHLKKRGGQTGCYEKVLENIKGKYFLRLDGDLQDNPADLHKFFPLIEKDADLIMGLREIRRHKKLIRLASIIYDFFVVILFDTPLHTNSSSFLAIKTKYLQGLNMKKNDHRYLPLIAIDRGASNIKELVIENRERMYGQSKYKNFYKVLFGFPEVIRFFIRLKMGYYKYSHL
jgi:glycosyltransferase involved in cell wall biosynthesis